jgi:hypothetical protein
MAETSTILKLDGVAQIVAEPLTLLADRLRDGLGENLKSITVIGSTLTPDFRPGVSDINTVVVLERLDVPALGAIASLAKPMGRKRLSPPLLMTTSYIARSRDVFGVEFLDFQLTHATILGADPFASITFEKGDVRLQCERELKAILIRLRQGYLAAAGNRKVVRDILISTAKGLAPLLRAMLWLKDEERPATMDATLRKAADVFKVALEPARTAEQWRYEKPRLAQTDVERAFAAVFGAVDQLATTIDKLEC